MFDIPSIIGIIAGTVAVISFLYFLYDRHFRIKHKINVEHGNISFLRMVSKTPRKNNKLALMICGLRIINTGKNTITLKNVTLRYKINSKNYQSELDQIPTGDINGRQSIGLAGTIDQIIIAWDNIRPYIKNCNSLQPGEVAIGDAIFVLEAPLELAESIKSISLVTTDYFDHEIVHSIKTEGSWLESIRKNAALIDAPIKIMNGVVSWEGIELTTKRPK